MGRARAAPPAGRVLADPELVVRLCLCRAGICKLIVFGHSVVRNAAATGVVGLAAGLGRLGNFCGRRRGGGAGLGRRLIGPAAEPPPQRRRPQNLI